MLQCHKYGHYKPKCQTNINNYDGKQYHFVEKEDEVSFLMAFHVKEENYKNLSYLDTGCSNHKCREKTAFSELNESFYDFVKFVNGFKVSVIGKGKVAIQTNRSSI